MSTETLHLAAAIGVAFANIVPPSKERILHPEFVTSEDALELREAFDARSWLELEPSVLFRHREMLVALSGHAYQAFVAAYLVASLDDDERTAGDSCTTWLRVLAQSASVPSACRVSTFASARSSGVCCA